MPRDGSGIYAPPPGTDGVPDTPIESARYNAFVADVEQDLNEPRPIVAGGTGATSAAGIREAIEVPLSMQTVTNYDSHIWENGAFWSAAATATAPSANICAGTCIIPGDDPTNIILEARDLATGIAYVRIKRSGSWIAWSSGVRFVAYNAGTLTAGQTLTPDTLNGNYQYYTNSGAHTIAVPAVDSALDILSTNGSGAGAISFTGYTFGVNTGDLHTTTNGHRFIFSLRRINGVSTYVIKALQ
jgi:hypothetical protein